MAGAFLTPRILRYWVPGYGGDVIFWVTRDWYLKLTVTQEYLEDKHTHTHTHISVNSDAFLSPHPTLFLSILGGPAHSFPTILFFWAGNLYFHALFLVSETGTTSTDESQFFFNMIQPLPPIPNIAQSTLLFLPADLQIGDRHAMLNCIQHGVTIAIFACCCAGGRRKK